MLRMPGSLSDRAHADQHLARADKTLLRLERGQRRLDVVPDLRALVLIERRHHLVQRAEGLALESHAFRRARQLHRRGDAPHRNVLEPRLCERGLEHVSAPSENGPGWPGSGAGNRARSRMIFTGIEKKPLRSGVE